MESQLELIHKYFDNDLLENALFLVERFHATHPDNIAWTHLRALPCLRLGRYGLAYEYSHEEALKGQHPGCAYVFGQACLGKKSNYFEGITALQRALEYFVAREPSTGSLSQERFSPDLASVHHTLGKLHRVHGDKKSACDHFSAALKHDFFLWDTFTYLCEYGASLTVRDVFRTKGSAFYILPPSQRRARRTIQRFIRPRDTAKAARIREETSEELPVNRGENNLPAAKGRAYTASGDVTAIPSQIPKKRSISLSDTSSSSQFSSPHVSTDDVEQISAITKPPSSYPKISRPANKSLIVAGLQHPVSDYETSTRLSKARDLPQSAEKNVTPLQNKPTSTTTLDTKATAQISPTQTTKDPFPYNKTTKDTKFADRRELQPLLELLTRIGEAYYHLCQFRPRRALKAFNSLPVEQQASPWVLSKLARTQYELHSYEESKLSFQVLRGVAPSWTEDLGFYSTVLWHLKDDVTLAYLAHELTTTHYLSPQTWCAVGNCFSIQKLSGEAIKCFRRACQLSPPLPQAFSLLGYEYIEAGNYDEAVFAFDKALDIQPRHYLAWVGLGRVVEKLGDYDKALRFYLRSRRINHNNPLLMIYVARAFELTGQHEEALDYLDRSLRLQPPKKVVCLIKMRQADLHVTMGYPKTALEELECLRKLAPGEPRVYFLLGQAHGMLGPRGRSEALKNYTIARSLDPRSDVIREAVNEMECPLFDLLQSMRRKEPASEGEEEGED